MTPPRGQVLMVALVVVTAVLGGLSGASAAREATWEGPVRGQPQARVEIAVSPKVRANARVGFTIENLRLPCEAGADLRLDGTSARARLDRSSRFERAVYAEAHGSIGILWFAGRVRQGRARGSLYLVFDGYDDPANLSPSQRDCSTPQPLRWRARSG